MRLQPIADFPFERLVVSMGANGVVGVKSLTPNLNPRSPIAESTGLDGARNAASIGT